MLPARTIPRGATWVLAPLLLASPLSYAADRLVISPANPRHLSHSKLQFTAALDRRDVTRRATWHSSNPAVATVASGGLASLLAPGTATIVAAYGSGRSSTLLTVTFATAPVFTDQPKDTMVDAIIGGGGGVRVRLLDNLGDPLPRQRVSLSLLANPPGKATLSGSLTGRTDATGTTRFPDLSIDWLGSGYTLVATARPSSGVVSGTSAAFSELRVGSECLGPDSPACQGTCPDADGDGLNDDWELAGGVDINGDGVITDAFHDAMLPGADPDRPDVFLKYDYMVAADHDHKPPDRAWDQMRAMFAAHGIALHVAAPSAGIPERRVTTLDPEAQPNCAGADFVTVQQLRQENFGNLQPAYHYMVFAHDAITPNDASLAAQCPHDALCGGPVPAGSTGVADVFGDDAIISFGWLVDNHQPISIELVTGTMMHELGHNFGLGHGSLADAGNRLQEYCTNDAPNFISVMNYDYELGTIVPAAVPGTVSYRYCTTDADCGPPAITGGRCATPSSCFCTDDLQDFGGNVCYRPDYAEDQLRDLNETALNESVGVGGPSSLEDIVWYFWNGGTLPGPSNGSPIDWNNDGVIADLTGCMGLACPDINADLIHSDQIDTTPDWTQVDGWFVHLDFQFQCTAGYLNDKPAAKGTAPVSRDTESPLSSVTPPEISVEWARQHHRRYPPRPIAISISPGCKADAKPVAAGQPGTLRVAVLGSAQFDVDQVDTSSLRFQGGPAISVSTQDVDSDGAPDLLAIFETSTVTLHPQATTGRLTGWLKNGQAIWGEDVIRVRANLDSERPACR